MHRLSNRTNQDDLGDYEQYKMRRPALRVRTWERKQNSLNQASRRANPPRAPEVPRTPPPQEAPEAKPSSPFSEGSTRTSVITDEERKARQLRAKQPPPSRIELVAQNWASRKSQVPRSRLKQLKLQGGNKAKDKKWWSLRNRAQEVLETKEEVVARIALSPELHAEYLYHTTSEAKKSGEGWYVRVDSQIRTAIDVFSLGAVIYCTFVVPFDLLFSPDKTTWSVVIDIVVEVFFICEIVLNFFTSYYDSESVHVTRRSMIAKHYLRGWFIVDLAGSVPGECLAQIAQAISGSETRQDSSLATLYSLKAIRIIRLFKLLRLLRLDALLENLEFSLTALTAILGLVRLLLMISILSHLTACMFYYMGTRNIYNSWISKYHLGCCDPTTIEAPLDDPNHVCLSLDELPTIDTLYTDCIYWSITTIAAVGDGDITPCNSEEQIFAIVAMVLGSALFAYVVGAISSVFATGTAHDKRRQIRMAQLYDYLQIRHIPTDMARLIGLQCMHKWKRSVFNEESLLNDFMPQTRRDVVEHILGNCIRNIPMFRYVKNPDYLTDATLMFKPVVANEETCINKIGDVAPDLYVVVEGSVHLLDEEGQVVATVKRGMAINEDELVGSIRETEAADKFLSAMYSSRPVGSVELFMLSRADFIVLLRRYPAIRKLYADFAQDGAWNASARNVEGNGAHADNSGSDEKSRDVGERRDPVLRKKGSRGSDSSTGTNGAGNGRHWPAHSPAGAQISPAGGRMPYNRMSPAPGPFKGVLTVQDQTMDRSSVERLMLAVQVLQAQIDKRDVILEACGLNVPYTSGASRIDKSICSPLAIDGPGPSSETHVLAPPPPVATLQMRRCMKRSGSLKEESTRQPGSPSVSQAPHGVASPSDIALVLKSVGKKVIKMPDWKSRSGNRGVVSDWKTRSADVKFPKSGYGISPSGKSAPTAKSVCSSLPFKSELKLFEDSGNGSSDAGRREYSGGNVATLLPSGDAATSQMLLRRDGTNQTPTVPQPSSGSKVCLLLPVDTP